MTVDSLNIHVMMIFHLIISLINNMQHLNENEMVVL